MSDEEGKSGGAAEPPRRRRVPPPTIDLEATDVSASGPAGAAAPDATPSDPPPETPAASSAGGPSAEPPSGEPPPAGPAGPSGPDRPAGPRRRFAVGWPEVAAAALGAALALVVAGGLWALLGQGNDREADTSARLSRIEAQLGALARPAPAGADARSVDDLAGRLGRIESTLGERLSAVEREIKPLSDRLADLGRHDDEAVAAARLARERADAAAKSLADVAQQLAQLNAARANAPAVERSDLDALATRLAGLEASTKQNGEQLARIANASNAGNTRRAVVAIALDTAVARGAPFGRELAALDPAAAGSGVIEALKPFADTGLPSPATLARELAAVLPQAFKAAQAPASGGGFLERLQVNAERLVRVRPIGQQAGDDPAAVLGRIEAKTAGGDVVGALAEAAKLPEPVRSPLEPWIKRAQAREAALAAAAGLAAQSLDVIRRPPQQGAADR
jgi:hypothetical protein